MTTILCSPTRRPAKPLAKEGTRRRYRKALKAAGPDPKHRFRDLRHTFGTRMAAAGVPMRTLQEWIGHADFATTLIYADYAPGAHEARLVEAAFARRDQDDRQEVGGR